MFWVVLVRRWDAGVSPAVLVVKDSNPSHFFVSLVRGRLARGISSEVFQSFTFFLQARHLHPKIFCEESEFLHSETFLFILGRGRLARGISSEGFLSFTFFVSLVRGRFARGISSEGFQSFTFFVSSGTWASRPRY